MMFGFIDPANSKGSPFQPGYQWYMHVSNKTFQPYADLIWKPVKNLTIEAGVKDSNFTIDLEAPVNQGTEKPDFTNNTYTNLEPHLSANYTITPNWSAYVQLAKGIAYPIVTDEENVPEDPKDLAATGHKLQPGEPQGGADAELPGRHRLQDGQVQCRCGRLPDRHQQPGVLGDGPQRLHELALFSVQGRLVERRRGRGDILRGRRA